MHMSEFITWGFFFSPVIAPAGHALRHAPHPLHTSAMTEYLRRSRQTFAGHFLSFMCASYSSLKYLSVLSTGFGAVCPRPQSDVALIPVLNFSSSLMSPSLPSP